MVNLTVINIKDILKYLVKVTLVIIIMVTLTRFFYGLKNNKIKSVNIEEKLLYSIKSILPGIKQYLEPKNHNINIADAYKVALNSELKIDKLIATNSNIEEDEEEYGNNQMKNEVDLKDNIEDDLKNTSVNNAAIEVENVHTEVLESKYNVYSCEIHGVKIKNESTYQVNENEFNIIEKIENLKNILIFHTHTCESYTISPNFQYQSTGNYRTTDLNFTVARVGDELEKRLKDIGFYVFHDKTFHDYPAYSGSYGRSLKTVQKLLDLQKNTEIVIDLHRDAIGDNTYAPKVKIGEEVAAQLMFVIGTNGSGLSHDNWRKNLEFAINVQKKAEEMYPGLFKPILLRNSRYNQHLSNKACIIEVGATGNTMEECLTSMKYLSNVLNKLII